MLTRLVRTGGILIRAVIVVPVAYLGILTAASHVALRSRRRTPPRSSPGRRHTFAILIPAHNEERLIETTLRSISEVDYPDERYSIHVVADNCTDRTVELARAAGVDVHEREDPDHAGKGPALQWMMARLWSRGDRPDAVVFVDADTTMDRGFLGAADRALTDGAQVVQAHYAVRGIDESPTVAFRAAALAARAFLRPLGRVAIGGSAGLHGNGMVFRRDVMNQHRWSNHLTEDVELHLDLLLDGTLVAFAGDARVEAEMPTTLEASRTQHERWERGRLQTAGAYVPKLVRRAIIGGPAGRLAYGDAVLDQITPPFSILVALSTLWAGAAAGAALLTRRPWRRVDAIIAGATLATQAVYVLSALRMTHAPPAVYRALLGAPRQVAWKIALWSRVVRKPAEVTWTRTARNQ